MAKDKRLGRGLAALLGETDSIEPPTTTADVSLENAGETQKAEASSGQGGDGQASPQAEEPVAESAPGERVLNLSVYEIDDNPFQPRRDFNEPEIASLAESLRSHDMLQPILVRKVNDRYQLISGERRLRAAIQAGWPTVPARLREADDRLVAELAIIENLQRKDLNPVEKALSFRRYIDEHACTQDDLARRLKIDRSTIANLMRLLELPSEILTRLQDNSLSAGHARALLPLGDELTQLEFSRKIIREGWSVRATERNVQQRIQEEDGDGGPEKKAKRTKNQQIASLEQELKMALGARVEIRKSGKQSGQIIIHFSNHTEFDRLRSHISGNGSAVNSRVG